MYFQNEVITHENRFLGNTSIEYDDEFIAIWNVVNPLSEDVETLAAERLRNQFDI